MHLPDLDRTQWLFAMLAALCVGLSKSGFSGVSMFTILLMARVMPAYQSTGVVLPLLICGDFFAVGAFRKHAKWAHIRKLLPPAMIGVVLGFLLMPLIPGKNFRPLIGWIVLLLVVIQAVGQFRRDFFEKIPHTKWFAWLMGTWTGFTTMLANAAGPVMSLYLLAVNLPKYEFVGTSAWFFLIINLFKVPFSQRLGLINAGSLAFNLMLAPLVLAGVFIGRGLIKIVPQKLFEQLLLIFAAAASLRLIFS
jgi:uncharacterized membrane protein YfcA